MTGTAPRKDSANDAPVATTTTAQNPVLATFLHPPWPAGTAGRLLNYECPSTHGDGTSGTSGTNTASAQWHRRGNSNAGGRAGGQ